MSSEFEISVTCILNYAYSWFKSNSRHIWCTGNVTSGMGLHAPITHVHMDPTCKTFSFSKIFLHHCISILIFQLLGYGDIQSRSTGDGAPAIAGLGSEETAPPLHLPLPRRGEPPLRCPHAIPCTALADRPMCCPLHR
jgi:hypothetical protein